MLWGHTTAERFEDHWPAVGGVRGVHCSRRGGRTHSIPRTVGVRPNTRPGLFSNGRRRPKHEAGPVGSRPVSLAPFTRTRWQRSAWACRDLGPVGGPIGHPGRDRNRWSGRRGRGHHALNECSRSHIYEDQFARGRRRTWVRCGGHRPAGRPLERSRQPHRPDRSVRINHRPTACLGPVGRELYRKHRRRNRRSRLADRHRGGSTSRDGTRADGTPSAISLANASRLAKSGFGPRRPIATPHIHGCCDARQNPPPAGRAQCAGPRFAPIEQSDMATGRVRSLALHRDDLSGRVPS